jgi:hypothetical protein
MAKSGTVNFYNGVATQSVRFPVGEPHLQRTPGTSGDQKTWTSSFWVKRTSLGAGYLWSSAGYSGNDGIAAIYFEGDELHTYYDGSSHTYGKIGNRLYRDLSAWYHICWAVDAANTIHKIWVNGSLESTVTARYPSNFAWGMNRAGTLNKFGEAAWGASTQFEGYLADFVHLDGQYLEYDSFAEFKNGVLIPIDTSGLTYGTNGFRLEFKETGVGSGASNTIGADTSGQDNHLDSEVIAADDCNMPDSPENNFCTLNPNARGTTNIASSEGNLKFVKSGQNYGNMFSTFTLFGGKWYFEGRCHSSALAQIGVQEITNNIYQNSGDYGPSTDLGMWDSRGYYLDEGTAGGSPPTYTTGDIIGVAFDVDAGKIWFSKNGTYNHSGDPANGTNQTTGSTNDLSSIGVTPAGNGENGGGHVLNFGQDASFGGAITAGTETDGTGAVFKYAPPSGFLSLCTKNLPEPTIGPNSDTQATDHFNTVLYTANSQQAKTVTGMGLQPDWLWIKGRSYADHHAMFDSNRGVNKFFRTSGNDLEFTDATLVTAFNDDGFVLGTDGYGWVNYGTNTLVAWGWVANGGTATATISESGDNPAAVVQANPTAGFSLITYTGTGDAGTIAHGLGAVPTMMIIKNRQVADAWAVYHGANTAAPATDYLVLSSTAATADAATYWADTAPTSSVFTVHDAHNVNADGEKYVAYVFADVEGYSKMGQYTGNGSADGAFVYTGFRPAFIMFKTTTIVSHWTIVDNARSTYNVVDDSLYADTSAAELTTITDVDFLSNGFKWRGVLANETNVSEQVYIYMAFAEAPFKYANAK